MAITIQPPQPGDLITASFMQQLIGQLQALDARVSQLEGVTPGASGAVAISYLEPADVHPGDELRIHGFNFGVAAENTVTFDGGSGTSQFKEGSNDRLLILTVPNLVFAGDSHQFTLTVANSRGSDSRQLTVRAVAPTIVDGSITPAMLSGPSGNVTPPSAVFAFTITAATNMDEVYDVTPGTVAAAGWSASLVTDQNGNTPLPQAQGGPTPPPWRISVGKSATVTVFVKVTMPNNATGTGFVKLDVASVHNPQTVFGSARSPDFTIGQPAPVATLSFTLTGISGSGAKQLGADSVAFAVPTPNGQVDRITFNVNGVKANASYTVAVGFKGAANKWVVSTRGNPQTAGWPFTTGSFATTSAGAFPTGVNLAAASGATQAQLQITVTNDADAKDFGVYMPFVSPA